MIPGPNGRRIKGPRHGIGKRWLVSWLEDGRRKAAAFTTKDAAELHLASITVNQDNGTHVATNKTTLAEYGDDWIRKQIHHRATTGEQLEIRWRVHIRPVLGHKQLGQITRADVQAAVLAWMDGDDKGGRRPLAASSIGVGYGYLSAILKSAVADRLIRETPCQKINLPRVDTERVVPLTVAQVQRIAENITPRYRMMVILGAATGMRSGELRGLTVDRLMFVGGRMRIRIDRQITTSAPLVWGPPKTAKSDRAIMVPESIATEMRRHMAQHPPHSTGLVFTGRTGGPMARTTARTAWHDATEGMDLRDRSGWHDLRHHHASLLIAGGLSVTAVADRLGHQDSTETLKTYAHLWEDDEERALSVIDSALSPLVSGGYETSEQPHSNRLSIVAGQTAY